MKSETYCKPTGRNGDNVNRQSVSFQSPIQLFSSGEFRMSRRADRINGLLRQEISQLLSREIKDPRLHGIISITQVQTSSDLRSARVFLSVMGDTETKKTALDGIQSAAAFLRRELRDRVKLRYVPFLKFALDDSIETADALLRMIDDLQSDPDVPPQPSRPTTFSKKTKPAANADVEALPRYDGPLTLPPSRF